jgi:glutamate 5-kinase
VGTAAIRSKFEAGEIVEILDESKHEIGCGITQISSQRIQELLAGNDRKDVDVIHRDRLIIY